MSPRKYNMVKRAATLEETREQIIAATVDAHRELGIRATSWDEIARRAGVGVGTVYRHFRSLDELLPACGGIVEQTMALPTPGEIPGLFDGVRSSRARIERLVRLVFDLYERASPFVYNIRNEREHLPGLEPWHQMIESTLDALFREALRPSNPSRQQREAGRALLDLNTWQAFKRRDLSSAEAEEAVARLMYSATHTRYAGRQRSARYS